ncbi:MAG: hypothetical protein ACE5MM_08265 [Nitrospiraceae bacterium]
MKKSVVIAAVAVFLLSGVITAGVVADADAAATHSIAGGKEMQGKPVSSLKGRVFAQWADNPDGEILFGIQYWNTDEPASGDPSGRVSSDLDVRIPDPLFVCCAWGFVGGTEKNNPYAGWYLPGTTVRLKVKDKALMDRIIKDSQDLVSMQVSLDGRTITGYKLLASD